MSPARVHSCAGWLEDALNNAVAIHTERSRGIGDVADFSAEIV